MSYLIKGPSGPSEQELRKEGQSWAKGGRGNRWQQQAAAFSMRGSCVCAWTGAAQDASGRECFAHRHNDTEEKNDVYDDGLFPFLVQTSPADL